MSRKLNINIVSFMLFIMGIMYLVSTVVNPTPVVASCVGDAQYMYAGTSSTGECMYFDTNNNNTMVLESER